MTDPASRRRRRWPLVTLLVLLVLGLAAGWTGFQALKAKRSLDAARVQLEVARAALVDRRLPEAEQAVAAAGAQTVDARSFAGDPVVAVVSHLPWAGRSVAVLRGVARGADDIARTVLPQALAGARALDPDTLRRADGSIDLAILAAARPDVSTAATRMSAVAADIEDLPTSLVPSLVAGPQREFTDQVVELDSALRGAADALEVSPLMLGGDRPRRWFVMIQQTSESRGTGGLPGGFAILEASKGKLTVSRQGSNADLTNGTIAPKGLPEDYVQRYGGEGAFDIWQNINLSPDLPVVSRYVAQRWKAQSGQAIDGVIAMDAVALADLLEGSGPVQVAPGKAIPPEGIEEYLALGQYAANPEDQTARKEELTVVADAVIARLTTGGGDTLSLLRGLSRAVRTGHVNVGTDDKAVAPLLRRSGTDGALPRDDRAFTYPVVFNAAGSKLEYFLNRTVRYESLGCDNGRRQTKVTLTLGTDPPALETLPKYVTIRLEDGKLTQSLVDRLGVSIYATRGARLVSATLDGTPMPTDSPGDGSLGASTEAGLPVWLTYLDLPPQQQRVLTFTLDEPEVKGKAVVLEQPLARPQQSTVDVDEC